MPRQQLSNEGLLLFWGRWRLQQQWQQQWPTETAMAMAMATAMVTAIAMAMALVMANGNSNSIGNSDGQQQWRWLTATATAARTMANGNSNGYGNGDGDGSGNGDGNGTATATATMVANDVDVTTTDTREGCLFMRWQCAVLWQGWCLASPHWTHWSVHCPTLRHGGATVKSVSSISRGGILTAHNELVFFIFTTTVQFTKQPFVPLHHSGTQELCQPIDALPPWLLLHLFAKVSLGGACIVWWQHAALWQGWHHCKEVPPPPPPPPTQRRVCCPVLSHGRCHCNKELSPPFQGEGSWQHKMDWRVLFFNYLFSLSKSPLSPHTTSVPQEPHQPITVYPACYCIFSQGKLGWGLQCL